MIFEELQTRDSTGRTVGRWDGGTEGSAYGRTVGRTEVHKDGQRHNLRRIVFDGQIKAKSKNFRSRNNNREADWSNYQLP